MAARGRRPGQLVRMSCCICGTSEMAMGAGHHSRCQQCRVAGLRPMVTALPLWTGKEEAGTQVNSRVRDGLLRPARECLCADCGGPAIEYDHRDYNKPFEVQPTCRSCNLRRGPAIPVHGTLHRLVRTGRAPYRRRRDTAMLLQRMGVATDVLAGMPPLLTLEHWKAILPAIPTTNVQET